MNKYFLLILMFLGISSCSAKDAHYYRTHPKELQQVMKNCPDQQPSGVSCQELDDIAIHINTLARQLQYSPQGFGATILKMQENIAKQEHELSKNSTDKDLQERITKDKNALLEHLAIVRWLESPES